MQIMPIVYCNSKQITKKKSFDSTYISTYIVPVLQCYVKEPKKQKNLNVNALQYLFNQQYLS